MHVSNDEPPLVRKTVQNTRVIWSSRRLAREFNLTPQKVAKILKGLGAVTFGNRASTKWVWDSEEQ